MRIALHRLLPKREKWSFQKANFEECTTELQNPARGWYKIFPFMVEEEPDFNCISWCDNDPNSLALVIINIGEYREETLPENAINNIRIILDYFANKQYDIILRITYDHLGYALEREPFFFSRVKEHMEQLSIIIHDYQKHIFVYQGMLIGNWGEMHTSKFISIPKLKELWNILKINVGNDVFFAVRKPSFWRVLHIESCDSPQLITDNMGLFDDAIFGSVTHLGTFGSKPRETAGWEDQWSRESELNFENELCLKVPNGGEVLSGERYLGECSIPQILDTLKRMHVTYLNETYDKVILDTWKKYKCMQEGVWHNKSMYDYIGAHLGYRFLIKDVSVKQIDNVEDKFLLQVCILNAGFANIYHDTELLFEWMNAKMQLFSEIIDFDLKNIDSGTSRVVEIELSEKVDRMWISACRKKDGRKIYFAHCSSFDEKIYLGRLMFTDTKSDVN